MRICRFFELVMIKISHTMLYYLTQQNLCLKIIAEPQTHKIKKEKG